MFFGKFGRFEKLKITVCHVSDISHGFIIRHADFRYHCQKVNITTEVDYPVYPEKRFGHPLRFAGVTELLSQQQRLPCITKCLPMFRWEK